MLHGDHAGEYPGAAGGVYPGYGMTVGRVGGWVGYTGTPPVPSQGPIYSLIQPQGPTHGQMKAILKDS